MTWTTGDYRSGFAGIAVASNGAPLQMNVAYMLIQAQGLGPVNAGANRWTNAQGNGLWDFTSANWSAAGTNSTYAYSDGQTVAFDDTVSGGTVTIPGAVQPAAVIVAANTSNYTFAGGPISGGASLTQSGTGTLTLASPNTFTGTTTIAGVLNLSNANALQNSTLATGTGTVVFDQSVAGHAFTLGGLSGAANVALQDNAAAPNPVALTVGGNNASTTYSGVLSGAGSLTKTGAGARALRRECLRRRNDGQPRHVAGRPAGRGQPPGNRPSHLGRRRPPTGRAGDARPDAPGGDRLEPGHGVGEFRNPMLRREPLSTSMVSPSTSPAGRPQRRRRRTALERNSRLRRKRRRDLPTPTLRRRQYAGPVGRGQHLDAGKPATLLDAQPPCGHSQRQPVNRQLYR